MDGVKLEFQPEVFEYIVDLSLIHIFIEKVRNVKVPVLLLINKIDLTNQEDLVKLVEAWHERCV